MKIYYAAICDDEPAMLDLLSSSLKSCFGQLGSMLVIDTFTSPADLLKAMKKNPGFQIYFLDIDMPVMNGIDLGVKIKELDKDATIIYISNREDKVFDAFRARPFGFIRKSSFLKDVQSVVKLYIQSFREKDERLLEIKTPDGITKMPMEQIKYIENIRDYQYFYLDSQDEPVKCRLTMKRLEEVLAKEHFLRVHQGYIVNYHYIRRIGNDEVELIDGTKIPMSRRKKDEVFTQFLRYGRSDHQTIVAGS